MASVELDAFLADMTRMRIATEPEVLKRGFPPASSRLNIILGGGIPGERFDAGSALVLVGCRPPADPTPLRFNVVGNQETSAAGRI